MLRTPRCGSSASFASLNVSEVWRWVGDELSIYALTGQPSPLDGYEQVTASRELPGFPVAEAERVVNERLKKGENQSIREFRTLIDRP